MSKFFKIVTVMFLSYSSLVLGVEVKAENQKQIPPRLKAKYIAGLEIYFKAVEPWLEADEVKKRTESALRRIVNDPDLIFKKDYLRKIKNATLTKTERRKGLKVFLLEKISEFKFEQEIKDRLVLLVSDDKTDITEDDYSVFLLDQEKQNEKHYFLIALLLRCKNPEDIMSYYAKLPHSQSKFMYYFSHTTLTHVYEKDSSYLPFYQTVLNDMIAAYKEKPEDVGDYLFISILRDIRITSGIDSLGEIEKLVFEQGLDNKTKYMVVFAAIQVYKKESLGLVKRYFTNYCTDVEELRYLTRALYWHGERSDVDPVVEAKMRELLKPIEAIQKEIPKVTN